MKNKEQDLMPQVPVNTGETHIACTLLLDTSGSMEGKPIEELNKGLQEFGKALQEDDLALGRAEINIITFDSEVHEQLRFTPAISYEAPTLEAGGLTSLNHAINRGLDNIQERTELYKSQGIPYYRSWLFVLTDGAATDTELESSTRARLQEAIRQKHVVFMPMGIGEYADVEMLKSYYPREMAQKFVLKADANNFKEAFAWLGNSIGKVTKADLVKDDKVQLAPVPNDVFEVSI